MIDFHTHILPGIDDGSRDIDMTKRMLESEKEQGVSHIYATPHFYAHRISVDKFLERRSRALVKTKALIEEHPELPAVTAGAEVYYFHGMGKAEQLPELCVEGTNILLLEMPFSQWEDSMADEVDYMINRRNLRIVLAHVERYEQFQHRIGPWDRIVNMPLAIQMNAGPFIVSGFHGRHTQKFCLNMLKKFDNCIIGTDCHNLTDRKPNLAEARSVIEKKLGNNRLAQLDDYMSSFLSIRQ